MSNLFLRELVFKCTNINLLTLLRRIFLRDLLTSDCKTVESFSHHSLPYRSLIYLKFKLPSIKFSKSFANRALPFLFRCNFFIARWFSFKFSLSINPIFFCLQKPWVYISARGFQMFAVFLNNNIRKR